MDEREIIQSAQAGNNEAFRQLFEENKNGIFSLAFRYTKNAEDAEDIVQETFIKAYNSLQKFHTQDQTRFSSWLFRISINCSIDHLRKHKKMKEKHSMSQDVQNISSNNENLNPVYINRLKEIREKIDLILNQLSFKQRMIFILRHYQHFSTQEIAEFMNSSQGSVKKQLFRAVSVIKKNFKSFFSEKNYEMQ